MSSLSEKIGMQALMSWKRLRLHIGLLTKKPYKDFVPEDIVRMLEQWKSEWDENDKEMIRKWKDA